MCNLSYRGFCRVSKVVAYVNQKMKENTTMLDKQEGKKGWKYMVCQDPCEGFYARD